MTVQGIAFLSYKVLGEKFTHPGLQVTNDLLQQLGDTVAMLHGGETW